MSLTHHSNRALSRFQGSSAHTRVAFSGALKIDNSNCRGQQHIHNRVEQKKSRFFPHSIIFFSLSSYHPIISPWNFPEIRAGRRCEPDLEQLLHSLEEVGTVERRAIVIRHGSEMSPISEINTRTRQCSWVLEFCADKSWLDWAIWLRRQQREVGDCWDFEVARNYREFFFLNADFSWFHWFFSCFLLIMLGHTGERKFVYRSQLESARIRLDYTLFDNWNVATRLKMRKRLNFFSVFFSVSCEGYSGGESEWGGRKGTFFSRSDNFCAKYPVC